MASQDEEEVNTNETKYMWIAVGVIVVIILGGMGVNMLVHHETSGDTVEMSGQPSNPQK
jgi:flagellar basal body-associated protein FliL